MKRTVISTAVLVTVCAVALPVAVASSHRTSATAISVSGKEFSFKLSKKSGARGTFIFNFRNAGAVAHDFKIAGKRTPLLDPGASAKLTVRIGKAGHYKYLCTVAGHATAGMKGVFTVR